jgi:outer membrane protein assembly factor BamB
MTQARVGVCLLLAFLANPLRAESVPPLILSAESRRSAQLLDDARKSLADQKWAEAVDLLQGVIDKCGNDLVPVGPRQTIQARRRAHLLLSTLPAEALDQYRDRVDGQARRLLEQGLEQRDPRPLRQLVEEAFCSRPAEKALVSLGDLAFERGDFDEAETWWRLLLPADNGAGDPPPDQPATELHYPRPTIDMARLRAKLLLARLFREGATVLAPELRDYAAKHPKAEGSLAGQTGTYAEILRKQADVPRPAPALDQPWPTFGGSASRGQIVAAPVNMTDRLGQLCQAPRWRFGLEDRKQVDLTASDPWQLQPPGRDPARPVTLTRASRSLAYYPVIAGGQVLVADARYVTGYDLRTGTSNQWYDAARDNGGIKPDLQLPAPADLRYSLTVAEDCVYARLGEQAIHNIEAEPLAPGQRAHNKPESLLVCLSFQPGPGGDRLRWQVRPGVANDLAVFEGAPVVQGGRVYIASTRYSLDHAVTAIHCYAAGGNDAPLRWRKDVCEASDAHPDDKRYRHQLLTAAGPNVVYCSHSGAVVALDAESGRPSWAVRYPQRSAPVRSDEPAPLTDLCPCLYASGRVYAAPTDSDRLFCLDALSGRILWERTRFPVLHLLGVSKGGEGTAAPLLIFTTPTGLRAVNAADGTDEAGWSMPDSGKLASMGRGLLLGDLVLWPTVRGVFPIRQADGKVADNPTLIRNIPSGNLAFGQGCLAVADRTQLTVFVPPRWRLPEREQQSRRHPTTVEALLELARSQADANNFSAGLATLEQADQVVVGRPGEEREPFQQQIVRMRHATLLAQAGTRSGDEADALLAQAAAESFPTGLRLRALKRRLDLAQQRGDAKREFSVLQGILADENLREQTWEDGLRVTAAEVQDQLARLRRTSGTHLFEDEEKTAQAILDACKSLAVEERKQKLEQLAASAPLSSAARTALRQLGDEYLMGNRPGAAAAAFRRWLALGETNPAEEASVLIGLAKAYEEEGCWAPARSVWRQLERRHGDSQRPGMVKQTLREYVADRLRSPEYKGEPPAAEDVLPLRRSWRQTLLAGEALLAAPWSDRVYTARLEQGQGLLACRLTTTGEPTWQRPLPFVPGWLDLHADLILAGGSDGLACVRREDGRCLWKVQWDRERLPGHSANGFHLQSGRVYVLQGDRRLLVYQAETGRLLWSQWAPGGMLGTAVPEARFHAHFRVLDDAVLLQTRTGRRWLLDAATGRFLQDAPTDREPWPRVTFDPGNGADPPPCLVREGGRIVRLDPASGAEIWSWALPGPTQLNGESVQLHVTPRGVLVLIPTNIGPQLQHLDAATGKPLWEREVIFTTAGEVVRATERLDLSAWSVDGKAVYLVREQVLQARSLADGKVLWEQTLAGPRGLWRTNLTPTGARGSVLLVYPEAVPARVWRFSWIFGSIQWIVDDPPEASRGQGCPIACYDPAAGQVVQRLNLPAGFPKLQQPSSVDLGTRRVMPQLTTARILLPTQLFLRVGGGELTAALAGQLFGYRPMPSPERSGKE